MVDCGSKPPKQKVEKMLEKEKAQREQPEYAKLQEECDKAVARAEKLESALKTIMLKFSDKKLCAKVAMEAMKK